VHDKQVFKYVKYVQKTIYGKNYFLF